MMMLALTLLFRAWTAPPAAPPKDMANLYRVVDSATPSDPRAIELLQAIAPKEIGDGSCYVEFERDLEDPVWQTKHHAIVRYFFVQGKEWQWHAPAARYPEHICWKDNEIWHLKPDLKCVEIHSFAKMTHLPKTPHRWLIASLAIDPDMELLTNKASITIAKEDDKSATVRLIPREKAKPNFGECLVRAFLFDPVYALSEAEVIDVTISKKENKVTSIRVVQPTKHIFNYQLKSSSLDRAGIEQSLASTPLAVPEGWKVNRIPTAVPADQN